MPYIHYTFKTKTTMRCTVGTGANDEGVAIDDLLFALLGGADAGKMDVLLNNVIHR